MGLVIAQQCAEFARACFDVHRVGSNYNPADYHSDKFPYAFWRRCRQIFGLFLGCRDEPLDVLWAVPGKGKILHYFMRRFQEGLEPTVNLSFRIVCRQTDRHPLTLEVGTCSWQKVVPVSLPVFHGVGGAEPIALDIL